MSERSRINGSANIYLAGKISKNGWRQQFVDASAYNDSDYHDELGWPVLQDALGPNLHYVGPFFTSCDHGCAHSEPSTHGAEGGCIETGKAHDQPWAARDWAATRCLDTLKEYRPVVIALIADDAHGTLVEIGYALGLGLRVILTNDVETDLSDSWFDDTEEPTAVWFPFACPGTETAPSVRAAIERLQPKPTKPDERDLCESPVEVAYLAAIRQHRALDRFVPAVKVDGGRFRIDFADTHTQIGIEIDGHQWHSSKEQFVKDRDRQRELEKLGWRLLRFAGSEVYHNADKCATQTIEWLNSTSL